MKKAYIALKTYYIALAICLIMILIPLIAIFCLLPSDDGPQVTAHGGAITNCSSGKIYKCDRGTCGTHRRLPSPMGIQQWLRELGHPVKVDGKIGPETLKYWNIAYSGQCAIEDMRKAK